MRDLRLHIFRAIARLDIQRPWLVLILAAVISIASVLYARARLAFQTGQEDLISADSRESANYFRYEREFPDLDGLIIAVRTTPSRARSEQFADALAQTLSNDDTNVKSVFYRLDPAIIGNRGMLYLSTSQLEELARKIHQNIGFIDNYAAKPTLANIFAMANQAMQRAAAARKSVDGVNGTPRPAAASVKSPEPTAAIDPHVFVAMLKGMLAEPGAKSPSPWGALSPMSGQDGSVENTYLTSDNGKYLLLDVAPTQGNPGAREPVEAIQSHLNAMRQQFPDVTAGMTGGPALAHAEAETTQHDMTLASVIAITALILLLVIPFRGVVEPAFAIITLLAGVCWSFGFATLAVGHLNLLSAVFMSILAGIGINFPIHLMARYDEARRRKIPVTEAIELAVVNTGTGVFASACIMALAFLTPMFTDFKGIAELGEISAAGLFLCLVSALFVFPSLIVVRDRNRATDKSRTISRAPQQTSLERLFGKPGWIMGGTIAITAIGAILIGKLTFDQNVLKLQASDAEAVRFENVLMRDSGRSSWFAVALAPTLKEADRKARAFRKLPEVSDAQTLSTYIPDDQARKRAILAAINRDIESVSIDVAAAKSDPKELRRQLSKLASGLSRFKQADPSGAASKISQLVDAALGRLNNDPNAFGDYERGLALSLQKQFAALKPQLQPAEITPVNLPATVRQRFVGASGNYLVQINPRGDIWEDAPLQRFVTALQTVDSDVTGPPIETWHMATVMRQGYERAAILALLAVFIFVFADFRNLRDALLATVPLVFGGLWLLETMGGLGWDFNLANLFAVPIIIGMGVDNGVNMLYRWREERDKSSLILTKAVGKSVTICSLTTIAAFAALIPASHRGVSSLGWVLTAGVSLVLVATLLVLPALFELLGSRINRASEAGSGDGALDIHDRPRRAGGAQG